MFRAVPIRGRWEWTTDKLYSGSIQEVSFVGLWCHSYITLLFLGTPMRGWGGGGGGGGGKGTDTLYSGSSQEVSLVWSVVP